MRYVWVPVGLSLCFMTIGCAWARRPYADDPLLRDGRGVWGDPRLAATCSLPRVEPVPPPPPYPENLPTLEWERHGESIR